MGLGKGNLTFCRYRLQGKLPGGLHDFLDRQIRRHAFRELAPGGEEKSAGWTSLENLLDTKFEGANYAIGDYVVLAMRMDRKILPSSLLKIKMLEEETRSRAAGKRSLSKSGREEMKERVRAALLAKTQPVPSFFDVCWSLSQNWVLFGSLSPKVNEEFQALFKNSFQLSPYPWVPWGQADAAGIPAASAAPLSGGVFLNPEAQGDPSSPALLGREFLTWLWFKSEERGGAVAVPGGTDVEVLFGRRVVLESGEGEYAQSVVCQGLHADLIEGKTAIREGKKIKEARMRLTRGSEEWEFTLKGDAFQFQSLRLPAGDNEDRLDGDREGIILERIYLVEKAVNTMEGLFSIFQNRRRSPQWAAEEIPRLKNWLNK